MPIYTYICEECKREFDLLVGVTSKKENTICEYVFSFAKHTIKQSDFWLY